MGIFSNKATAILSEKLDKAYEDIERYKHVQELLVKDILTLQEVQTSYKGNDYTSYETAVTAIGSKYQGTADWGVIQTGTVIDLRAAFILGEGIEVAHTTDTRAEAERELKFCEDFFYYNGLESEMAQELAKEAEIEGKIALKITYDDFSGEPWRGWPGMISTRFISWTSKKYDIIADPTDYLWYKQLRWRPSADAKQEVLEEPEFVYKKFGGRLNNPNDAQPKIMKCLTQIDRLDRALRDLREINHLFASPTPDFKLDDPIMADKLLTQIRDINWKIGKVIVHCGEFSLVSPEASGIENLIKEIELNVKMIAGTTGIPIHYLGLLDLLHNRATGENTRELVMAATARERQIWIGVFEELIDKAMEMYNSASGEGARSTRLDPTRVSVSIPLISQDYYDHLEKVYMPAAVAGIISKEAVAEMLPGIDMEQEAERREEAEAKELDQAKADLDRMRMERNLKGVGGEGNEA